MTPQLEIQVLIGAAFIGFCFVIATLLPTRPSLRANWKERPKKGVITSLKIGVWGRDTDSADDRMNAIHDQALKELNRRRKEGNT